MCGLKCECYCCDESGTGKCFCLGIPLYCMYDPEREELVIKAKSDGRDGIVRVSSVAENSKAPSLPDNLSGSDDLKKEEKNDNPQTKISSKKENQYENEVSLNLE